MNYKDFDNLKLGQWLFTNEGKSRMINGLRFDVPSDYLSAGNCRRIRFSGSDEWYPWNGHCICYHVEKPKQKKRYWAWRVRCETTGCWNKCKGYLDDKGNFAGAYDCMGRDEKVWDKTEKIKDENDYIEV